MNKIFTMLTAIAATFMVGMQSAVAALPAAVTTAITSLETDGLAMIDLIWGPVVALTVGFILLKLFKRGAGKV